MKYTERENRTNVIVLTVMKLFSGNLSFLDIVLTLQSLIVSLRTIRFNRSKYLHTAHTIVFTYCISTS